MGHLHLLLLLFLGFHILSRTTQLSPLYLFTLLLSFSTHMDLPPILKILTNYMGFDQIQIKLMNIHIIAVILKPYIGMSWY